MKFKFFFFLLPLLSLAQEQVAKGLVLDAKTQEPIPYVNMSIIDSKVGTSSDEDGSYALSIYAEDLDKMITLSSLGYQNRDIKVAEFIKLTKIYLRPSIEELNEVLITKKIEDQFDLTAIDIKTANAQFETGTTIRNLITYAVSITLLIVAGFGIYNILNMLIYEKMNDIAILKATGFTGNDVMIIFISEALVIGIIGGILGLLLGYGTSAFIDTIKFETEALPTIKTYPINYEPMFYFTGIGFALIFTFLAGYLPAIKAKKIDPVEIIRGK